MTQDKVFRWTVLALVGIAIMLAAYMGRYTMIAKASDLAVLDRWTGEICDVFGGRCVAVGEAW